MTAPLVWIITGAANGMGLALALAALARGDYVIATAREVKSFDELRQDPKIDGDRLKFLALDVTAPFAEIQKCLDEAVGIWGRIDVLVNNAGTITFGLLEELGSEGFMKDIRTNLIGAMNVTNAVLPHMRRRREGTVVLIGSRSAFRTQLPGTGSYCASKAALHSYGETLAAELNEFNVRVIVTIPGGFSTKFNAPTRQGTPLEGYEPLHAYLDELVPNYGKIPKGDPDMAMNALLDVVRGEGRAAGHGPAPLWLFLGEDCMRDVRARTDKLLSTLEEWKDVGSNLGLPAEQTSA